MQPIKGTGLWALGALLSFSVSLQAVAEGFMEHPDARALVAELAAEGLDAERLRSWLESGQYLERTTRNIASPTESRTTFADYRALFVNDLSIERGQAFMAEHAEALARVESELGIDPRVVAAIIGVETRYGRYTGGERVLDAIGTTAFSDSKRRDYFLREMRAFLTLVSEEELDPLELTGSYAGAMGVPQFMPSSFRAYAVDFDGNGQIDIWDSMTDAIGSVANYLAEHRWQPGVPVALQARVSGNDYAARVDNSRRKPYVTVRETQTSGWAPTASGLSEDTLVTALAFEGPQGVEYWYGTHNFYAITRYNHSILYALTVHQLSQEL